MMRCVACAKDVPDGASSCPSCGAPAQGPAQAGKKTVFGYAPAHPVEPPRSRAPGSNAHQQPAAVPPPAAPPAQPPLPGPGGECRAQPPAPGPGGEHRRQQVIALTAEAVDDQAKTIGPGELDAAALRVARAPGLAARAAVDLNAKTIVPGALAHAPAGDSAAPPPSSADLALHQARTAVPAPMRPAAAPAPGMTSSPPPQTAGAGRTAPSGSADTVLDTDALAPALVAQGTDVMLLGEPGAERASGIPGLQLAEDERLVAVERPGALLWVFFVGLCLLVITLPVALWLLLRATGRAYVITNRRAVRVGRGGELDELLHSELLDYRLARFAMLSNASLELIPRPASGKAPLRFTLCGPSAGLARLWGVIHFWLLSGAVSIEDAPAVDAQGQLITMEHDLDISIVHRTWYRKGLDLQQAQRTGVTILTPQRLIWLREEDSGSGGSVHATIPVFAFLQGLARRSNSVEELEDAIVRVGQAGAMAEAFARSWTELREVTYARIKGLHFIDGGDGKRASIYVSPRHHQQVADYLAKIGIGH